MNSLWVLDAETGKDLCPLSRPNARFAFSPDGFLVGWPAGDEIVLADAATGKEVRRWPAHTGSVGPLAFAPDGAILASAGGDRHIRLWHTHTGKEIRSMQYEGYCPSRLAFAADGRRLASVSGWHSDVCVWDVATGERRHRWQGDRMTSLDPGVRVVAVADRKAQVLRLADALTGKALHTLPGYQERVRHQYSQGVGSHGKHSDFPPLFSPEGRLLLSGGAVPDGAKDGAVYIWDVAAGKRLAPVLYGGEFVFENMAFSPDSRLLALTRSDLTMCLLDTATGKVVRTLGKADGPMGAPPAFTPDGHTLVTVVGGLVQVWEVATGGEICRRQGHRGSIFELTVAPDGRACATVAYDYLILIWDLTRLVPGERPGAPLTAAELDAAWDELASPDAAKGRHAIELLTAVPAQALALVQQRLPPVPVPDGKQVARWLLDLGGDNFKQRERATEELGRLEEAVGPALREALAANPPLEARRRMEGLQKRLNPAHLPPRTLRAVRAVQVLEAVASPEARGVLQELARGAPGVRVTDEAAATLRRLEARARSKRSTAR
jgi:WD40 repeat protein